MTDKPLEYSINDVLVRQPDWSTETKDQTARAQYAGTGLQVNIEGSPEWSEDAIREIVRDELGKPTLRNENEMSVTEQYVYRIELIDRQLNELDDVVHAKDRYEQLLKRRRETLDNLTYLRNRDVPAEPKSFYK